MSDKAHPEDDAPNATFLHTVASPTASTVGSEVQYPASGKQVYRVRLHGAGGVPFKDVLAATGDEAADMARVGFDDTVKVTHIEPAPQSQQREKLTAKAA